MSSLSEIRERLEASAQSDPYNPSIYYKTGPGQYGAHDRFLGVRWPVLRKIAKEYKNLTFEEVQTLLDSPFNEERFLALVILVNRYQCSDPTTQNQVYSFYLKNLGRVNNWNLVDASAHLILGAHLFQAKDQHLFLDLAQAPTLWERRIGMVATWYFIRQNKFEWTLRLGKILIHDPEDLMHKAVGWMLREMGKRDQQTLETYLQENAPLMPRTMLRYAIERFPEPLRKKFLAL